MINAFFCSLYQNVSECYSLILNVLIQQQPASQPVNPESFCRQRKNSEGLVLLVTSRRLYNHIPFDLKPIHCGYLFRSAKSSSSGEKSYLCYLLLDNNKITSGGPELDESNCTLGFAPERSIEFKQELCALSRKGKNLCFQYLIDRPRRFHISL